MKKLITINTNNNKEIIELSSHISNIELENSFKLFENENLEVAKQIRDNVKNVIFEPVKIKSTEDFNEAKIKAKELDTISKQIKSFYEPKVKAFHQLHKDAVAIRDSKIKLLKTVKDGVDKGLAIFLEEKRQEAEIARLEQVRIEQEKAALELKKQEAEQQRIREAQALELKKQEAERQRIFEEQSALNEKEMMFIKQKRQEEEARYWLEEKSQAKKQQEINLELELAQAVNDAKIKQAEAANALTEKIDTSDLKIRRKPKKLEFAIKPNKLVEVIQKIQSQGLDLSEYLTIKLNKKNIKTLYEMKFLNDEVLDVKEIETFASFK